ncbi:MAG: cysteine hydrolase, partial [Betaproteobacteria bacterium]|nr:cysteine hydrolase [Betaproteobacteria bacterium]
MPPSNRSSWSYTLKKLILALAIAATSLGAKAEDIVDTGRTIDYLRRLQDIVLPNLQLALSACRATGLEVLYTYIEALTADGRDQSLDYRLSGIFVPRGSPDAAVMPAIAPAADDILLPKTASSVFNATHIDYVLRNLGVRQLVIAGVLTEQCVESAVR